MSDEIEAMDADDMRDQGIHAGNCHCPTCIAMEMDY